LLAQRLPEETLDIDYASADAELAKRLAEEDAAAAADDQYLMSKLARAALEIPRLLSAGDLLREPRFY
jgi:hypothetical protein